MNNEYIWAHKLFDWMRPIIISWMKTEVKTLKKFVSLLRAKLSEHTHCVQTLTSPNTIGSSCLNACLSVHDIVYR